MIIIIIREVENRMNHVCAHVRRKKKKRKQDVNEYS